MDAQEPRSTSMPKVPGGFVKNDPRRGSKPKGLPNKINRPGKALLEAHQEQAAKDLLELTEKPKGDPKPCPLCLRGMPEDIKNKTLRLSALSEVMDRGGTPRLTQHETIEKPDTEWLEYATPEECMQLERILEACRARMPINASAEAEQEEIH